MAAPMTTSNKEKMKLWLWRIALKVLQTCLTAKCNSQLCNRMDMVHIRRWEVRLLTYSQTNTSQEKEPLINMTQRIVQIRHLWHLNICASYQKKSSDKARLKQTTETKIDRAWRRTKLICKISRQGTVWI